MSNFSDFFPSGGGSVVASITDLPRGNFRSNFMWIKNAQSTLINSETADFWTYYARQYAVTDLPSDVNNYTTLLDVNNSNGGVLYHVIAGSAYYSVNSHSQYIKITIDGEVTEIGPINMATPQYRSYHPVLGALMPFQANTSTGNARGLFYNYDQWFENNSSYIQTKGFVASYENSMCTIPTPIEADLLPKIKFNSTLKVEAKGYTGTSYNGHKTGVAYKLF